MAYDPTKDKKIRTLGGFDADSGTKIEVAVFSYGDGPEKIGINRLLSDGKPAKLGRLSMAEASSLKTILP